MSVEKTAVSAFRPEKIRMRFFGRLEGGSVLERMVPATPAHKQVLTFQPERSHCRSKKDVCTIENCVNVVVFVWLTDGQGYWYHIKSVQDGVLVGYILINDRWVYNPIRMSRVDTYF